MKKNFLVIFSLALIFVFCGGFVFAAESSAVTDWYVDNFDASIVANSDSSLLITEKITADCGTLPDKHGIFRVLPLETKTDQGAFKTPVEMISITDFQGNPYEFQSIKDNFDKTITWKIGDKDKTVTGKNYYKIVYKVKNAVRFQNENFDELYWNLAGAFWQIPIEKFSAEIIFPNAVNSKNTFIDYYTGYFNSKGKDLANFQWKNENTVYFYSLKTLKPGEAITISAIFPKGIFTPYKMSFWEKYGNYLGFIMPLAVLAFCFLMWKKYGKDFAMKKPIPPEFGIPEKITPIQMGTVSSSGSWRNNFITACIIDLAVRKFITIEEIQDKILFFKLKDFKLNKIADFENSNLTDTEKIILKKIFGADKSVKLSSLKNNFYQELAEIKKSAFNDAIKNEWVVKKSSYLAVFFLVSGVLFLALPFILLSFADSLFFPALISATILIIFGSIMPKRTRKGTDLLFKIKGFERYMKQAENYRQQFYEKENIFDKFLPYAIIFGITKLWVKKMKDIYGEKYFETYHPVWFVGSYTSFNADSFTSQLNSITASISQSVGGASGASGAGGAGGGGGGGGGGGW